MNFYVFWCIKSFICAGLLSLLVNDFRNFYIFRQILRLYWGFTEVDFAQLNLGMNSIWKISWENSSRVLEMMFLLSSDWMTGNVIFVFLSSSYDKREAQLRFIVISISLASHIVFSQYVPSSIINDDDESREIREKGAKIHESSMKQRTN